MAWLTQINVTIWHHQAQWVKLKGQHFEMVWTWYTFHELCTQFGISICCHKAHVDSLVQDCSISIANALEILQSFPKPSMYSRWSSHQCRVDSQFFLINTMRQRQNGRHFTDDVSKCIFLNENVWISIKISLKFVPKGLIKNIPALVQIMAWRRPGDKPLCEPMMVTLLMHICVTQPQWVKTTDTDTPGPLLLTRINFNCSKDK